MTERLIIFDGPFQMPSLLTELKDPIDVFPLTDNWRLIHSMNSQLTSSKVQLLNAAKLIDEAVRCLREKLIVWSADLGERNLAGKSLKEWFLLRGEDLSSWWFSLFSEKNPLKTDVFLRLAQVQAIKMQIGSKRYRTCFLAVENKSLAQAVLKFCQDAGISVKRLPLSSRQVNLKTRLASKLERAPLLDSLMRSFHFVARAAKRSLQARHTLGPLTAQRLSPSSLLFVSYFPAFNREKAMGGIFSNRYAAPLQDFLARRGSSANWLLMTVPLDGSTYADALRHGKSFAENGEAVFFLEEFLSLTDLFHCLALWWKQTWTALGLYVRMPQYFLAEGLAGPESEPFLKGLWFRSFAGYVGISSITFLQAYKNAFKFFTRQDTCIYYLEMQDWEKALNAARRQSQIKTIGFQHSAFSMNHFSYFYAPSEIRRKGNSLDLPLPDILGCNGAIPYARMREQGYSDIRRLEAIRHFYLENILNGQKPIKQHPPVVLLLGPYDKEESKSLFLLLHEALPAPQGFEVWIKSHPACPFDVVLQELGIDGRTLQYRQRNESMNELLTLATTVIACGSSVTIDALGFGCQVIVPVLSNAISMNPLEGHGDLYRNVYTPAELKNAVQESLEKQPQDADLDKARQFVASYWDINSLLPNWSKILSNQNESKVAVA